MKQAIEEGFILDVLQNFTRYETYYQINKEIEEDPKCKTSDAKRQIARFVTLHEVNIGQRVEIIIEHFRTTVMQELNGMAKAMVVTSSREEAVRYRLAFDEYVQRKGYTNIHALVAFSGKVEIKEDNEEKANIFNCKEREQYIESLKTVSKPMKPPRIIIEAYLDLDDKKYAGTNNELREDCSGIRMELSLNQEYADAYKQMLKAGEVYDIPVELYSVSFRYFKGGTVAFRFAPVKASVIDTTRKDYSYVMAHFVTDNITTNLTSQEQTDLSTAYRKSRHSFVKMELLSN